MIVIMFIISRFADLRCRYSL